MAAHLKNSPRYPSRATRAASASRRRGSICSISRRGIGELSELIRRLLFLKDQEVLIGKELEVLHELESRVLRLADDLGSRDVLLGRVRSAWSAGGVVDDCHPTALFHPGGHRAIKIDPVADVVGGVAKKYEVNSVFWQHRIVFTGDDGLDVVQAFLVCLLLQITEDIRGDVDRVDLTVRR